MTQSIRVVIVDDHLVTRRGIISLLADNPKIELVGEGSAGNHVLELVREHKPDVLITDLQMPSQEDGPAGVLFEPIASLKKVIREHENISVVVLSQEHDVQTILSLAEIGVKGYILKTDVFAETLGATIEEIHVGTMYFSPEVIRLWQTAPRLKKNKKGILTEGQLNTLNAFARSPGASRDQIAQSLHVARSTIDKHAAKMFAALDVPNMIACILKANRMGLIKLDGESVNEQEEEV